MDSLCFIVNEESNSGQAGRYIRLHQHLIQEYFPQSVIHFVSEAQKLEQKSKECSKQYDIIVACGGDGTVHTVGKAVFKERKILGVIPAGSGNDFAKTLNLKTDVDFEKYLAALKNRHIRPIDVPVVNHHFFLNTFGIGFDGLTNYYAASGKYIKGRLKYTLAGIHAFFTAKPFNVSARGGDLHLEPMAAWMAVLANGSIEGGAYNVSPGSQNNDGKIELVVVPAISRLKLAVAFLKLTLGQPLDNRYSQTYSLREGEISITPRQWSHRDGEVNRPESSFIVAIHSMKLNVITA